MIKEIFPFLGESKILANETIGEVIPFSFPKRTSSKLDEEKRKAKKTAVDEKNFLDDTSLDSVTKIQSAVVEKKIKTLGLNDSKKLAKLLSNFSQDKCIICKIAPKSRSCDILLIINKKIIEIQAKNVVDYPFNKVKHEIDKSFISEGNPGALILWVTKYDEFLSRVMKENRDVFLTEGSVFCSKEGKYIAQENKSVYCDGERENPNAVHHPTRNTPSKNIHLAIDDFNNNKTAKNETSSRTAAANIPKGMEILLLSPSSFDQYTPQVQSRSQARPVPAREFLQKVKENQISLADFDGKNDRNVIEIYEEYAKEYTEILYEGKRKSNQEEEKKQTGEATVSGVECATIVVKLKNSAGVDKGGIIVDYEHDGSKLIETIKDDENFKTIFNNPQNPRFNITDKDGNIFSIKALGKLDVKKTTEVYLAMLP